MTNNTMINFAKASADDVRAAYAALPDAKAKAAMRAARDRAWTFADEKVSAAMAELVATMTADSSADTTALVAAMTDAKATRDHIGALSSVMVTKATPVVHDYAADAADRIADLFAAVDSIMAGNVTVPDGATVPTPSAIMAALSVRGLDVEKVTASYVTLSGRKASRARDGAVADYIVAALSDDDAPDAMTAAMIAKSPVETDDYTGDSRPSVGAIGAAFGRGDDRWTATTVNGTVAAKLA